ncbi:DUF6083 domain-containing protein [Streptomyces sp. NBC_00572]|uniref:DUF6083 domain-containing protein n=1 Tax=Streptomyces sp. NBC_00572 TaxID=2903664 RepID=UPI002252E188|nr:DUF6083 domain-containing protein [Streptomyces sp. NBC_00572]MCX4982166.1 DUF6083 domain-containing protein [Streptomyces sp. NBC_00572]
MGTGRRSDACDSCGALYGTWIASLGMALCSLCEGTGAGQSARDPVLVGDVLAGLVDAASFAVRAGGGGGGGGGVRDTHPGDATRDARLRDAIRDVRLGTAGVPEPRSGGGVRDDRPGGGLPGAGRPAGAVCRRCGARAEWHRTVRGRWIMIEPGELMTAAVPAGSRWRVAGDGTAVNLGSAVPSDTCRVSHFDVCAAGPEPVGSPVLLALWRGHARRIA